MAVSFNEDTVAAEPFGVGAARQRLLTRERVRDTPILLDRIAMGAGGRVSLEVPPGSVAWFQMLEGEAVLSGAGSPELLSDAHIAFLPPAHKGALSAKNGATLLYAEVPEAARYDSEFERAPPRFRLVDWTREPVLDSQHDARKRIYLVTPKLFGSKVLKGEMIMYPKGTLAANHHHEGAAHFMYILRGKGTVWVNEQPSPVAKGDVVYYPEFDRHYLAAAEDDELVFGEFFVPGEFKTVWVNENEVCTWLPTGRDFRGQTPVREIKAHSSALVESPQDV
jgi:quercetin dioxygenase-like cupin family protein